MYNRLIIFVILFFNCSCILSMQKPTSTGSAYNHVRLKKIASCPERPAPMDNASKLRPKRHSDNPSAFQIDDHLIDGIKTLLTEPKPTKLVKYFVELVAPGWPGSLNGNEELIKERERILDFDKSFHRWEYLLPEEQKILFYTLPAYYEYRRSYGGYFYGNWKSLKPDYEKACLKIQELMDNFYKEELPKKLKIVSSFSLIAFCRTSFNLFGGRRPVFLFDRNQIGKEYKERKDIFLNDPFSHDKYLGVIALQEAIFNMAAKESIINREYCKK